MRLTQPPLEYFSRILSRKLARELDSSRGLETRKMESERSAQVIRIDEGRTGAIDLMLEIYGFRDAES